MDTDRSDPGNAGNIPEDESQAKVKACPGPMDWRYPVVIALSIVLIPAGILVATGQPVLYTGAFVGSTLVLQAAAVGLLVISGHKIADFLIILSIGLGFILLEFLILDTLAHTSARVQRWVDRVAQKAKKLGFIKKYGVYTLVPLMWIPGIGLYGGAVIAWILEFERRRSIALLFAGWVIACFAVLLVITGVLAVV